MDVLSDVLAAVRLESTVFANGQLVVPWGIRAEAHQHFAFHIIARGRCWLEVDGQPPVQLGAGDVVIVSRGHGHSLRDSLETPLVPLRELLASGMLRPVGRGDAATDGNATTQLVCGCFALHGLPNDVLVSALPPVIHARELATEVGPWLAQTVKLLNYESVIERPGAEMVINRLCDALFVYVLRSFLAELPEGRANWLRALVEPQVGPALRLIHETPAEPWTVASLATRVGMSRSAFAVQFTKVVGETPMQYLIRWRLRKAAGMLRGTPAGIAEIAAQVGYDSEAAFNKAFKRSIGVAPGAYRRASRSAAA